MKMFTTGFAGSLALALALFPVSCSEAERTYDCGQICDNYATCVDSELDTTDCIDACEDRGEADSAFAKKASDCEDCLDGESCASASVECTGACAEVIARSALGQGGAQD